jgi:hypothetical protein
MKNIPLHPSRTYYSQATIASRKPRATKTGFALVVASAFAIIPLALNAAVITPDFGNVPTGWAPDRYAPNSFSDVGTYQGRNDVLGIGISSAQSLANRPAPYQSAFYNTQGDGYQFGSLQGAGSVLSADLWISSSMGDPANGAIRTDMWGVMNGGEDYPIIGFANTLNAPQYAGSTGGHFQIFDGTLNGGSGNWVILGTTVNYNAWNSFSIDYTGSSYVFDINGNAVYTENITDPLVTGFSAMIMEAVNFGDPATYPGVNPADYTAYWSNTPVPEPTTMAAGAMLLLPLGACVLGALRRKQAV